MFNWGPSETIRAEPDDIIGIPSLVQVYEMLPGFALAIIETCNGSPSVPTAFDDGGGINFGASTRVNLLFFELQKYMWLY